MKKNIPPTCSKVHLLLGKSANDRNIVAAFRAVDLMEDVSAPNDLVIAAEHDDPRNPDRDRSAIVNTFPEIDHVSSNPSLISFSVPGRVRYARPLRRSPFTPAATHMKHVAILYSQNMYSSCPTLYWCMRALLRLLIVPLHTSQTPIWIALNCIVRFNTF